jgi:hypothetical protein
MTPGQARIALLSFLFVAAGVVVNAHFLQARRLGAANAPGAQALLSGRMPTEASRNAPRAPGWPGASTGEGALRIARFAPASAKPERAPDPAQEAASPKTIAAIQRELIARGYGPLTEEGVMGPASRAAIIAFEHDHGLPLTGEASEPLLKRILLGGSAGADNAGSTRRVSAQAEQAIRAVQQRLSALGYRVGHIDGRMGDDTVKAIRDFEMDQGLVPKGRISAEVVARLGEAAPSKPWAR